MPLHPGLALELFAPFGIQPLNSFARMQAIGTVRNRLHAIGVDTDSEQYGADELSDDQIQETVDEISQRLGQIREQLGGVNIQELGTILDRTAAANLIIDAGFTMQALLDTEAQIQAAQHPLPLADHDAQGDIEGEGGEIIPDDVLDAVFNMIPEALAQFIEEHPEHMQIPHIEDFLLHAQQHPIPHPMFQFQEDNAIHAIDDDAAPPPEPIIDPSQASDVEHQPPPPKRGP